MKQKPLWVFKKTVDFYADYRLDVRLGGGAYGKVFKCIHKESKDVRAVKIIQKYQFARELDLFRHEITIMKELDHAHLIKFYGVYETSKFLFIVMELCEGGEQFTYMRQKFAPRGIIHKCCPCLLSVCGLVKTKLYTEKEASHWLRQVCEGLAYLHSKRIVHADIKPQNIMLKHDDKNSSIRIIDFGLSSAVKKKHQIRGQDGTPEFMAPEVVKGKYTFHSDMWSFGVLIFTMLFGFSPFWTTSVYDTYRLIVDHGFDPEKPTDGFGNSFPSFQNCSDDAKDLIIRLQQQDPIKRLSAQEALEHKWFTRATDTPIEHPVVQNQHQIQERSRLQRLVLNMVLKTVDEKEIDHIHHEFTAHMDPEHPDEGLDSDIQKIKSELYNNPVRSPTPGNHMHKHFMRTNQTNQEVVDVVAAEEEVDETLHLADEWFQDINMKDVIIAAVEHRLQAKEERLWNCFDIIDTDGNGVITAEELSTGLGIPLDQAKGIIMEADVNGDGCIDLDEFVEQFLIDDKQKHFGCTCDHGSNNKINDNNNKSNDNNNNTNNNKSKSNHNVISNDSHAQLSTMTCASPICKNMVTTINPPVLPVPIPIPSSNIQKSTETTYTIGLPGAVGDTDGSNMSLDVMTLKIPDYANQSSNNSASLTGNIRGGYNIQPGTPLARKLANYQPITQRRASFTSGSIISRPGSSKGGRNFTLEPVHGSILATTEDKPLKCASPLPNFYYNNNNNASVTGFNLNMHGRSPIVNDRAQKYTLPPVPPIASEAHAYPGNVTERASEFSRFAELSSVEFQPNNRSNNHTTVNHTTYQNNMSNNMDTHNLSMVTSPLNAEFAKDVFWLTGKYDKITQHINEKTNILYNQLNEQPVTTDTAKTTKNPRKHEKPTKDELVTTPILRATRSSSPPHEVELYEHVIARSVASKTRHLVNVGKHGT